jgi:RimJ/RimL family protein N-acetyltransferase
MFYLQKVKIYLATSNHGEPEVIGRLEHRLRQQGCCVELVSDCSGNMDCAADTERAGVDISSGREKVLWITDSAVAAGRLTAQGCAVLVFLHESNRQEDFSACRYACESLEELDMPYLDRVYRRLRGLPWDILTTERCLIRETTVDDVEEFYRIYEEPAITRYMEPLYENPEEERAYARDYINQVYAFYDFGIWTVVEKSTGRVIGRAGICYREGFEDPELGFVIAADRQGQGFATEVCSAILSYVAQEHGFQRILALVQPDNTASRRVCSKLGMSIEGQVALKGVEYDIWAKNNRYDIF